MNSKLSLAKRPDAGRRLRSLLVALAATISIVVVPTSGYAAHDGRTLDVTPETATGTGGTAVSFTATLNTPADATSGAIEIDFEIEGGPNDISSPTNALGATPAQPDFTCTVAISSASCNGSYIPSANSVGDVIRAWIHHNGADRATEADANEGANEVLIPGSVVEGDRTDVVQAIITGTTLNNTLDCDDESPGESGTDDTTTNPNTGDQATTNETYTCSVTLGGSPVPNAPVDAEMISGPNDPDAGKAGEPDFSCVTATNGKCMIDVPQNPGTLTPGVAIVCFWNDADNDAELNDTVAADGGDCAEAVDETESNDVTDTASITWQTRSASQIDIVNEDDSRVLPGQPTHTVNLVAKDQFGAGLGGVNIDLYILGGPNRDSGTTARDCITVSDGTCAITYTSGGSNGIDRFCAWRDTSPEDFYSPSGPEGDGGGCATEPEAPGTDGAPALTDRGQVTWSGGAAVATQLEVTPERGTIVEGTDYTLTASVKDENGSAMAAQLVNFEIIGAGDPDATPGDSPGTPDRFCTTSTSGTCFVEFVSNVQGFSTVRSWVASQAADTAEGADAGGLPNEPEGGTDVPGATVEPDTTDVVAVRWGKIVTLYSPITMSPLIGTWGIDPTVSGKLMEQAGGPVVDALILIKRRYVGGTTSLIATRRTSSTGNFSFTDTNPSAIADYFIEYFGDVDHEPVSRSFRVGIRPGVVFNVSPTSLQRNRATTLSGLLAPGHPGKKVNLQRFDGPTQTWKHVQTVTLDSNSRYSFRFIRTTAGSLIFRITYVAQDSDHLWNVSRNLKVTWT